jgi:hypothetical protein
VEGLGVDVFGDELRVRAQVVARTLDLNGHGLMLLSVSPKPTIVSGQRAMIRPGTCSSSAGV